MQISNSEIKNNDPELKTLGRKHMIVTKYGVFAICSKTYVFLKDNMTQVKRCVCTVHKSEEERLYLGLRVVVV